MDQHHAPRQSEHHPHRSSAGSGTNSPQERQPGRHRRARLSWWWPQLPPPGPGMKVTLEDLQRWLAPERAYVPRPRRIVVLPRQRATPDAPATSPNTVPYQGADPSRVRTHHTPDGR